MDGQYRQITPEQRADHIDNLMLLGRLVITLPTRPFVRRSFVVMTVEGADDDERINELAGDSRSA